MFRTLRSAVLILFGYTAGILYACVSLLLFWAPHRFLHRFVDSFCRLLLWAGNFFCGLKVVAEGRENLPKSASVVMIRHSSALETYGHVPFCPMTTWVIKREVLWIPIFGWALKLVFRPIAIDRGSGTRAVKQVIKQGKQKLADGNQAVGPGVDRKQNA